MTIFWAAIVRMTTVVMNETAVTMMMMAQVAMKVVMKSTTQVMEMMIEMGLAHLYHHFHHLRRWLQVFSEKSHTAAAENLDPHDDGSEGKKWPCEVDQMKHAQLAVCWWNVQVNALLLWKRSENWNIDFISFFGLKWKILSILVCHVHWRLKSDLAKKRQRSWKTKKNVVLSKFKVLGWKFKGRSCNDYMYNILCDVYAVISFLFVFWKVYFFFV